VPKIFNLFRWKRDQLERDLDRELKSHVDRRIHDLIESGVSEPEARRHATIEFGGVARVQESSCTTTRW
jgi:hypothetical protein